MNIKEWIENRNNRKNTHWMMYSCNAATVQTEYTTACR